MGRVNKGLMETKMLMEKGKFLNPPYIYQAVSKPKHLLQQVKGTHEDHIHLKHFLIPTTQKLKAVSKVGLLLTPTTNY